MPKVLPDYKAQAKERITGAGLRVFANKGFHRTTMNDIAKEVGVSKGDLYLYFPTKVDLLRAIQVASQQQARERMNRLLHAQDRPKGLVDMVDRFISELSGQQNAGLWFDLMMEVAKDPATRQVLREDQKEDRRTMASFLKEIRRIDESRGGASLDDLALAILMLFYGAFVQLSLGTNPPGVRRALRTGLGAMFRA